MVTDFSNFDHDVLDLISKAHGYAVRYGRPDVDSSAILVSICNCSGFDAERLFAAAGAKSREINREAEVQLMGDASVAVAHPNLADELDRVFSFAMKIASKCHRAVMVIDVACALGVVDCKARKVYRKFGVEPKGLDDMLTAWNRLRNGEEIDEHEIDYMAKLDALVGLTSVKDEVRKLADMVRFNAERIKNGLSAERLTDNFVFRGNPGTGKTEVARIIAGIYRQFGALKRGHLVEVDRSRLVAGYVGQSAIKTNEVVDSALDGVLFIDEAYALAQGGGSDYGAEVASVLVKRMEDDRNRLVVIAAGYADEMDKFVGMNPGFSSRFTKTIDFPDYTGEELTRIFEVMAKAEDYECTKDAIAAIRRKMDSVAGWGGRTSGNARNVRNLLKAARERMAARVLANGKLTKEKLRRIEVEDIG